MGTERKLWIDTLKGIAVIVVIASHCELQVFRLTPSFSMAPDNIEVMFFLMAGMFVAEGSGFFQHLRRVAERVLIPLLFFSLAFVIAMIALGATQFEPTLSWVYSNVIDPNNIPLWFLWAYFWLKVLYCPAVCRAVDRAPLWAQIGLCLALIVAGRCLSEYTTYHRYQDSLTHFLFVTRFPVAVELWWMAWLGHKIMVAEPWLDRFMRGSWKTYAAVCVVALVAWVALDRYGENWYNLGHCAPLPVAHAAILAETITLVGVCRAIGSIPVVMWVGRNIIVFLGCHYFWALVFLPLLPPWLVFVVAMALSAAVVYPLRRYTPYLVGERARAGQRNPLLG